MRAGPCQGSAAGLGLGRLDGEPPAELVGEPLVCDRLGELIVFGPLPRDAGLGTLPAVEGPAAPEATDVRANSEVGARGAPFPGGDRNEPTRIWSIRCDPSGCGLGRAVAGEARGWPGRPAIGC